MLRQEQMPVGSNPTARHFFFLPFHSNTSALAGGVVVCLSPSVYMRVLRQGQTLVGSNRPGRRHRSLLSPLKTVYAGRSLGGFSFLIQKDVEFTGSNPVAGALVEITTPADGPKVCPRNIEV